MSRSLCRADERTASAFYAKIYLGNLKSFRSVRAVCKSHSLGKNRRVKTHRTSRDASSAVYTGRFYRIFCLALAKHHNCVSILEHGSVERIYGNTHHRTAVKNLTRLFCKSADKFYNIGYSRAYRRDYVLRVLYCRAVDRDALLNESHCHPKAKRPHQTPPPKHRGE